MRAPRTVTLILLGALALSGCTLVPTASAPARLSRTHIPFGLLNRTIPGTNGARVRFITQPVYIVDATGHLAPSSRIVPSPPKIATVLRQLILGPTPIEVAAGYSSALPRDLVVVSVTITHSVAAINLATSLSSLPVAQQILAAGQLALTAKYVGAVNAIEVLVGGVAQATLLPNHARSRVVPISQFERLTNG